MKRFVLYVVLLSIALVFPVSGSAAEYGKMTPAKETALKWLDAHAELGKEVSLYVWHYPELGLGEHYSSAILQDVLKKAGFSVVDNVAGMKTAFVATWGQGKPVIGIHAEFDALPGISQVAGLAEEKQIVAGAPGHGCGHNVFGTYSVMAAIAVKEAIEKNGLAGTIKLYGTPAEETLVGKAYFVKDGIYKDDDIVISWHPGSSNGVSYASSLAM
ncbi:MAG TPA: amidohydrolase, partial [Synergistaceae bacterium]|nr:amidohydrolase [Synergistaceae bacterium]